MGTRSTGRMFLAVALAGATAADYAKDAGHAEVERLLRAPLAA